MEERNELRCQARTWGLIPGIVGVVVAITLALLFFGGDWVHHIYRYWWGLQTAPRAENADCGNWLKMSCIARS